ncbi:hypothetical protein DFAR_3630012 [Desulfarculales bacterium]
MRWAASRRHPSEYQTIWVTASQSPSWNFIGNFASSSKWTPPASPGLSSPNLSENRSWRAFRTAKRTPSSSSDEASLLRLQVLAEVHAITQFQGDSKPILPIILAGQSNLADLLI